uniref:Uncharacterized protein n=1 Tax=Arundo donax TaxID=35708 RepID=A0A0A9BX76_ARUDO
MGCVLLGDRHGSASSHGRADGAGCDT